MATSYKFGNQKISIPGAYSRILSGISNPPLALDFGNTLIIDTGSGAAWGGGAGIAGTLEKNKDALYTFDNLASFRTFVGGGLWWDIAPLLFQPDGPASPGVSSLTYVRAATTTPAEIAYIFGDQSGSDSDSEFDGGKLVIQVRAEGEAGNGKVTNSKLVEGYAGKLEKGVIDSSKYVLKLYRTGFKGNDSNGTSFNNIKAESAQPVLLAQSPEIDNVQELIDWANDDTSFNEFFKLKESNVEGNGRIDDADQSTYADFEVASGGVESFSSSDLQDVLDAIEDINYDFILADEYNDNAKSSNNDSIVSFVANTAKIKPDVYIGGGNDDSEFEGSSGSLGIAEYFDSQYVTIPHGGRKYSFRNGQGYVVRDSIYKAAQLLGREAGLEPEVPLTFKEISGIGEVHKLSDKQQRQALDGGVLAIRNVGGTDEVLKGINSQQRNNFLVYEDGSTPSKQLRRIGRQINKEITFNARQRLLKQPNGPNRNTITPQDVQAFVEGYLNQAVEDGLIIDFRNITVEIDGDAFRCEYQFIPSFEVSFAFFEGFIKESFDI